MRKLALISLFILVSLKVSGQLRVGPKIGLTLSQQTIDSEYLGWKSGLEFGAIANMPISDNLYLQSEFLVTQKGYKEQFGSDELFNELTATYWQLPVTVQYRRGFELEYYGSLGFYISRWQSGKYRSKIIDDNDVIEQKYQFTSNYNLEGFRDNRTDFGLIGSVGLIYPLSVNDVMLDVRYNHGLSDVNDLQQAPEGYNKQSNRNIVISLTFLFYL